MTNVEIGQMNRLVMKSLELRLRGWHDMDNRRLKERGFFPNQVYGNGRRAAIVVKINETGGGGAVNARCLDDAMAAIESGRLDAVNVILHDGVHVVGEWPVGDVIELVAERHDPIIGKWGPYYWLMPDFSISTIEDFKERMDIF